MINPLLPFAAFFGRSGSRLRVCKRATGISPASMLRMRGGEGARPSFNKT